jgi:hypothetical protein
MAKKYLRALQYTTGTNGRDVPIFMRLCYEFWGYCVNGTASLTTPGGMPTTPTSAPVGFFEGASVLATGSDGVTHETGINFDSLSANFPISYIGKHITIWSTSTDPSGTGTDGYDSTDNSIYRIVNVPSSTQLMLVPFSGGTHDVTTQKNNLSSRSALNYRIIDVVAASQLAISSGNYFVGTLSGASGVNTGQASSQFQFFLRGSSQPFGQFNILGSPVGSWTGAAFTGTTLAEQTLPATNFTGVVANVQGYVTLIADKDFFMGHIRTPNSNAAAGLYFYVIIPQRLYTQAQDLNPMTIYVGGNNLTATAVADSHSTKFNMVYSDNVTRVSQLMTRNFVGDGTTGTAYTLGPNLSALLSTQNRINRAIYSDALISNNASLGSFALARCKLRIIAFTSATFPQFHLFGDNGEFIHVGNGVLWPWDGSVIPNALLPLGT